jgi:predicted DNA-binding protein
MARTNKSQKSPSRKRYEESHPTRSCRLNEKDDEILKELLEHTGRSFADFVKDHIRKEEAMVEKRVEILASKQIQPAIEHRLNCLEDLVHQIFSTTVDTEKYPPLCPYCDNQELFQAEGREIESRLAHPWVRTWKCPKCGFFINTYKRIEPKSIKWTDPDTGKYIDKPKTSSRHWLGKNK